MKLLVFAHTPPPHHGQSYMVQLMLDGFGGDARRRNDDPDHPPVPESATHYSIFREVQIKFTRPEGLIESDADEAGALGASAAAAT